VNPILQQAPSNDETLSSAAEFFRTFGIAELFNRSAGKGKGIPAVRILQFLFALVFLRKTFFEMMRENSLPWGKDTFYRFLSESRINWRRFLLVLAKRLLDTFFLPLTMERKDPVLVLDDSAYSRNRSKKVELLSKCYDHCDHRHFRGFRMLSLGWSDGRSFLPLAFSLLGSAKEENRLFGARETDGRTRGAHRRKEAVMKTPEAALVLLDAVLSNGMKADFLLFDSWFATNQFLHSVHRKGVHSIAMVKDFNSMQFLVGREDGTKKRMKLSGLYGKVNSVFGKKDILGSVLVEVDNGKNSPEPPLPVKVVFVRNRKSGAKREWLAILCTDTSVPDEEVVRIYGKRWSIEVFFKACKSVLRLSKEFQTRSCDSMVAHTGIVFLRYMMLSFELGRSEDDRAYRELFYRCCEELKDISFIASLALLLEMLKSAVQAGIALTETILERMFTEFVRKTPGFLRNKIGVLAAFSMS